jgi:hypothetical protein
MNDRTKFELVADQARDPLREKKIKFGPGDPGHITHGSVEAGLGKRPIVYDIRKLLKEQRVKIPGAFHLLENHEIWVVYYAFGIAQESNFKEVVRAGLEVRYGAGAHVTIFQVFPTSEFINWGGTEETFQTEFQLSEEAGKAPANGTQEVAQLPGALPSGHAAIKVGGKVALALSLKVATLHITVAGMNNDYGLWEFRKHDEPLVGDHQVGHILLVKRPMAGPLAAEQRFSVDVGTFSFWTSSRFMDWVPVSLEPPP